MRFRVQRRERIFQNHIERFLVDRNVVRRIPINRSRAFGTLNRERILWTATGGLGRSPGRKGSTNGYDRFATLDGIANQLFAFRVLYYGRSFKKPSQPTVEVHHHLPIPQANLEVRGSCRIISNNIHIRKGGGEIPQYGTRHVTALRFFRDANDSERAVQLDRKLHCLEGGGDL